VNIPKINEKLLLNLSLYYLQKYITKRLPLKGYVLLSETKEGMQQSLNTFELYCDLWKLDVNINRTNGMVFSKEKNLNYSFILQDKQLKVVEKYSYLGIIIINLYKELLNFGSLFTSLHQYEIIRSFTRIS
jgi:hypothetical protein